MTAFKIAILTEIISSHSGSRFAIELAKSLSKLGNNITLYAFNTNEDKSLTKSLKGKEIKVTTFKEKSGILNKIKPHGKLTNILRKEKFNFAISCSKAPFFLSAKLAGIPVVKIYMGTQFNAYLENKLPHERINFIDRIYNLWANLIIYLIDFLTLSLSTKIISISKYCAGETKKLYFRKTDSIIYIGANHIKSKQTPVAQKNSSINLLSVSRITPYKGFDKLISTVNHFPNKLTLTIVGTNVKPSYFAYLKRRSKKNIKFFINLSDQQLAHLYQKSDIYITADKYLFFGLPIVEAAFFKKGTIAFSHAAAAELIENGKTGFLVTSEDKLKKALVNLIKKPNLIKTLGNNAYLKVHKDFTWQTIALKYQQLFEEWFK